MSNLNRHIKSDKAKWIITGIVFVLILAILGGVVAAVVTETNPKDWFNKPSEENSSESNPPAITDGEGNEMESGKTYPMPANMVYVSSQAETVEPITIKATVKPDFATNKSLRWSIDWKNSSSEWANGKSVYDYVSFSTDGELATIAFLTSFGEQILISVESVDNPDAKAECVVDCAQKIKNVSFNILNGPDGNIDFQTNNLLPMEWNGKTVTGINDMYFDYSVESEDVYTVADNFTYETEVTFNLSLFETFGLAGDVWVKLPSLNNFLPEKNVMKVSNYADAFSYEGLKNFLGSINSNIVFENPDFSSVIRLSSVAYPYFIETIEGKSDEINLSLKSKIEEYYSGGIDEFRDVVAIKFSVKAIGKYSNVVQDFYGYIDFSYFPVAVESIELDKNNVCFFGEL